MNGPATGSVSQAANQRPSGPGPPMDRPSRTPGMQSCAGSRTSAAASVASDGWLPPRTAPPQRSARGSRSPWSPPPSRRPPPPRRAGGVQVAEQRAGRRREIHSWMREIRRARARSAAVPGRPPVPGCRSSRYSQMTSDSGITGAVHLEHRASCPSALGEVLGRLDATGGHFRHQRQPFRRANNTTRAT